MERTRLLRGPAPSGRAAPDVSRRVRRSRVAAPELDEADLVVTSGSIGTATGATRIHRSTGPSLTPVPAGTVQRKLLINGTVYGSRMVLMQNAVDFAAFNASQLDGKMGLLLDKNKTYDLATGQEVQANALAVQQQPVVQPVAIVRERLYLPEERKLQEHQGSLAGKRTYNVAAEEAAGFLAGQVDVLGTEGLSGCVGVMIDARGDAGRGFLVAHVFSGHRTEQAVRGQLDLILAQVNSLVKGALKWSDFDVGAKAVQRMTLVTAEALGEEPLYRLMTKLLSGDGAKFYGAASAKVFFDLTGTDGDADPQYNWSVTGALKSGDPSGKRTAGFGKTMAEAEKGSGSEGD